MDLHEPSVDSKDREERVRARRLRITEKIQAKESGEAGTSVNVQKKKETDRKEVVKGKEQIAESRRKLRLLLEEGDEDVTKVRVEGDDRENQRRINEEAKRLDRRQKLLFEAESSARRNAAIAMKWASLFEKEIPLELLNDMEAQREACLKVISQKDELVKEFQLVLRGKDEEYVKSLKRWAEVPPPAPLLCPPTPRTQHGAFQLARVSTGGSLQPRPLASPRRLRKRWSHSMSFVRYRF